ncbi:Dyp-type peroxidase [Streptomyces sp. NPDC002276]
MTNRRGILRASLGVAAVGTAGLGAAGVAAMGDDKPRRDTEPAHLRGTAPLPHAQVLSLGLVAAASDRGRQLQAAHRAVEAIDGGCISAWSALGSSAFPETASRPRQLRPMPPFAGDVLDPSQSHGDLLVQITGTSRRVVQEAAEHTLRQLPRWRVRWRLDGIRPENRTEHGRGLSLNPFHFTEGYANPAGQADTAERAIVAADQGEPAWAVGGSYQVIRIIQLATAFWNRDTVHTQERIVGRRRDGRWLDGTPSAEQPAFTADPQGKLTPLDAHVRRATPDQRSPSPLVRRGYNYHHSDNDQGLILSCFQHDLAQGFEAVQHRLQGEAMAKYTLTVGGGYFFVPPPGDDWIDALA